MRRILAVMRRNLQNMMKSPRVADESMFGDGNVVNGAPELAIGEDGRRRAGRNGFSIICSVVRAPISLLSWLSHHHHHHHRFNGADGAWSSSELARISDMNHLMVNDSMRYAILL
ncbi:hypothetical protein U1Q18_001101 [Sarracenia purpurea var. burkii]